jgi:hypothetical protein
MSGDDVVKTYDEAVRVLAGAYTLRALIGSKADGEYWSSLPAALEVVTTKLPPKFLNKQDIIDVLVWGFANSKKDAVGEFVAACVAVREAGELDAVAPQASQSASPQRLSDCGPTYGNSHLHPAQRGVSKF